MEKHGKTWRISEFLGKLMIYGDFTRENHGKNLILYEWKMVMFGNFVVVRDGGLMFSIKYDSVMIYWCLSDAIQSGAF